MKSANVELGEVCSFLSGFAFKAELFSSEPIGLPLIRIRDVLPGRSNTYYSGPYQSEYVVKKGDILIGMDGEFNRERWKSDPALLGLPLLTHTRLSVVPLSKAHFDTILAHAQRPAL